VPKITVRPLTQNAKRHTYTTANASQKTWESAQRLSRPKDVEVDSVGIVAIIQPPDGGPPSILLQRQFRPPIDAICIEVPAGLVDAGETPEECGLRELKEETGYVGEIMSGSFGVSPVMYNGMVLAIYSSGLQY